MAKPSILIAEDDLFLQQIYLKSLEQAGYSVSVIASGREVLEKIKTMHWDVVLLDLNMPEVSGMEVLSYMNKEGLVKTTPVIILTNFSEEEYAEKCLQLGAKAFFTKSNLSFEDILMKINQLVKNTLVQSSSSAAETPTSVSAPTAATAIANAPVAGGKPRILVIEDDPFLLEIYKQNLQERGYDATAKNIAKDALDLLEQDQSWNVILLDLLMPEIDGFTVLERMKAMGISQKIPVIVLTNLSQENDQKKAKELGAVDFAIKSELSFDEIVARVESALKQK